MNCFSDTLYARSSVPRVIQVAEDGAPRGTQENAAGNVFD